MLMGKVDNSCVSEVVLPVCCPFLIRTKDVPETIFFHGACFFSFFFSLHFSLRKVLITSYSPTIILEVNDPST